MTLGELGSLSAVHHGQFEQQHLDNTTVVRTCDSQHTGRVLISVIVVHLTHIHPGILGISLGQDQFVDVAFRYELEDFAVSLYLLLLMQPAHLHGLSTYKQVTGEHKQQQPAHLHGLSTYTQVTGEHKQQQPSTPPWAQHLHTGEW